MNWALLNEVGFLPLLPACANAGQGLLDGGSLFGGRGTTTMSFITRRRAVDQRPATQGAHELRATLRWPHLMALGVGAIVGTGIYTLTGVGAGMLLVGLRESANLNLGLVVLKIAALVAFVALTLPAFDPERFTPFLPFGFSGQVGPDDAQFMLSR